MPLTFIPFRFPEVPGVRCAFQIRAGHAAPVDDDNISLDVAVDKARVAANRAELVRTLGLIGFAEAHQVHGVDTIFEPGIQPPALAAVQRADGLATAQPGLGLMIKTADCQPLLLADRSGRHVAALHCGWRGNRQNYPAVGARDFMARYALRPEDVFAVRGPSLSPARAEFVNFDAEWGDAFRPWFRPASRTVDLWRLTRDQLQSAGLPPENIYGLDLCTLSLGALFSFRRSPAEGRQASVIWIEQ